MSRHLWQFWRTLLAPAVVSLLVLSGCEPIVNVPPSPSPCAVNNGGCAANAICSASLGAANATCTCPANFIGDGHTCSPGSVCDENNGGCDVNATCTAVNKAAQCACHAGFEGDGFTCTAVDLCQRNNGGCGAPDTATCSMVSGQVACDCHSGYKLFGTTCIPACELNNGECGPLADCVQGTSSISCECVPGYQKKDGACVEDPCRTNNGGCGSTALGTCSSSAGVASCECLPGAIAAGDTCVDECSRTTCPTNATCGHAADRTTVCTCNIGYILENGLCVQDPCAQNNGNCGPVTAATCSGTPTTGAICTCNPGYRKQFGVCVDPCAQDNGGCGTHASCTVNVTSGNPQCACHPGYESNGTTCVIDPCAQNNGGCGSPLVAACTSTRGVASCACRSGFALNSLGRCVDVCQVNNGGCTAHSDCAHLPQDSAVQCTCSTGYQLAGGLCVADPCLTNNGGCGDTSFASCASSGGVATCTCGTGYAVSGGTCVDACTVSNGSCWSNSTCGHAADNAVTCTCNGGFLPNGNSCYANQCLAANACDASEDCLPKPTGRDCVCKANFVPDNVSGHCKPKISSIAAGGNHLTCATKYDGTLLCAGNGAMGPLVSRGTTAVNSFVPLSGSWKSVSAGTKDVCAIDSAGTLKCWHQPQTGSASATPTTIQSGETWKAVSVSLTGGSVCAIRSDGSLWCWGSNGNGQLGTGDKLDKASPTRVGIGTLWASISTGEHHTCGVQSDGFLRCWGSNAKGALGTGTPGDTVFETLVNIDQDWSAVAAGAEQTCAIKTDGSLYCWGCQGLDTACWPKANTPTRFGSERWSAISAGGTSAAGQFVCGLHLDGSAWCWGDNTFGQLADANATTIYHSTTPTPTRISVGVTNWDGIKAGDAQVCASRNDGSLWCWGSNLYGEAGDETDGITPALDPSKVPATDWTRAFPSANGTACATRSDGSLWCWGDNDSTIGDGTTADQPRPKRESSASLWSAMATSGGTCGIQADKSLLCWGPNNYGELGSGAAGGTGAQSSPLLISADKSWESVCTGQRHACAVKNDHTLWCWGNDSVGQLGTVTQATATTPTEVSPGTSWATITCGDFHTCATHTDGTLWCWGSNSSGQAGTTTSLGQFLTTPSQVGSATNWGVLAAGTAFTCGRQSTGLVSCWGDNASGQLGQGAPSSASSVPLAVGTTTSWVELSASGTNVCGRRTGGSLFCWGSNTGSDGSGMLGSGDLDSHPAPFQVFGDSAWTSVAVGAGQTCATQQDSTLWCWGSNTSGQLGNGVTAKLSPVQGL